MRQNNKGFSLVELIVALAIFAIAGVAVFGFMVNSSRLYQRTNVEVKLQYEQQLAVNQIRDMVVESDRGIYFDEASKTLALYGAAKQEGAATVYPVTVVRYVESEQKMYYGIKNFAALADVSFAAVDTTKLLAENVKAFKVDLTKVKNDKVLFDVTFIVGDKEQTAKETVALRNRLVVSNEVDTIWGDMPEVIDSFIRKITISRDGREFANGEQDVIGKADSDVIVVYTANVIANEDSERDYKVAWSVDKTVTGVGLSADGQITVAANASETTFTLTATSVDDPSKSAFIEIEITDTGVYPVSMTLEIGDITEGNGFRKYTLVPTVTYSNNISSSDYSLFTWEEAVSLSEGGTFSKDDGVLTLGPGANGKIITITAKVKERKADGTVLSKTCDINVDGILAYVSEPSIRIAVAKNLSRGGYVFPTMVFKNATHSDYTYNWKIEPYADEESDTFSNSTNKNERDCFGLLSLAEEGYYNQWNTKDTLQTNAARRSVTLNCAPWLDWSKTFKVKVSGTATDTRSGKVLEATPVVVTIEPVSVTITRYNGVDDYVGDGRPTLVNSALCYEDWYWDNKTPETEDAKNSYTRRWFVIEYKNLYVTDNSNHGTTSKGDFDFMDAAGKVINSNDIGNIEETARPDKKLYGFRKQMINWERCNPRPAFLNYSILVTDRYGNSITSNTEEFYMDYKFINPTAKSGE